MRAIIHDELKEVEEESDKIISKLETATDMQIGLEMLHLFGM
jgi:hypothetical protein